RFSVGVTSQRPDADGESKSDGADETAVERLQRRYAEGELTEAEFERALERELGSDGTTEAGAGPVGEPDPAREAKRAR
ncbi:SHOCT domain-containing protein, partial [Halorubrum ezzemoulense]|uniref:SHOCT domain-containing protein n=1 Tax=Halorubrum ezzemoulense TaxID=337243 RepID=UPI00117BA2D1